MDDDRVRRLLKALPEIDASPETWGRIAARLGPRRTGPFKLWLRVAAAASIVAAIASFGVVFRGRALPVAVETGEALAWGSPFSAEAFTTVLIPGTGTLKLDPGAVIRPESAGSVVLESGQLFAEIAPSGRGFEIRTDATLVRVHGTRFGVVAPSTVYVVEGRVEVVPREGARLELGPREVAVGPARMRTDAGEYLRWLARYEQPGLRLTLDPGDSLRWKFILETGSVVPIYLGDLRDVSQQLSLQVDGTPVSLDSNGASLLEGTRGDNGLVRLDLAHRCVLECRVDPRLFRGKGPAEVRAVFSSGPSAPEPAWIGILRSPAVTVEVP